MTTQTRQTGGRQEAVTRAARGPRGGCHVSFDVARISVGTAPIASPQLSHITRIDVAPQRRDPRSRPAPQCHFAHCPSSKWVGNDADFNIVKRDRPKCCPLTLHWRQIPIKGNIGVLQYSCVRRRQARPAPRGTKWPLIALLLQCCSIPQAPKSLALDMCALATPH